ncbi:MAG: Gfo/Idh/MocA family oxidoreductase [Coprobacillus sp.]
MKLGILGTGMIVKDLLHTFHEFNIEKAYILGTNETKEETESLKNEYHLDKAYYDYDELLASDVDTIYCALPNHLHYMFCKKALENHKHVIIEKPITTNPIELKDLILLAKKNHKIILEAMNIHYLPAYLSLKEHIKDLGQLKIVSFNYSQYSSRYNAFKEGNILPAFDYQKAGGALMDLNVYNLHAIIGLFGRPLNVEYYANIEKQIDTSGIVMLDYGSFKAVSIAAKDCKAPIVNTIQGDNGYIRITSPVNQMRNYLLADNQGKESVQEFNETDHRLIYEFKEFIRIIETLDYDKSYEMLETSLIVSEVMKEARQKSGIVFGNE